VKLPRERESTSRPCIIQSKGDRFSVWVKRGLWDRERHRLRTLRAPSEYVVFSVYQLDTQFVLTGRQTRHADCIVVTRFHPTPREVVDVYVQMPDPWRCVDRACPEHW